MESYKTWTKDGNDLYFSHKSEIMIDEKKLNTQVIEKHSKIIDDSFKELYDCENRIEELKKLIMASQRVRCENGYHEMMWTEAGNGMWVCKFNHCNAQW
jgi:hypothetical protein